MQSLWLDADRMDQAPFVPIVDCDKAGKLAQAAPDCGKSRIFNEAVNECHDLAAAGQQLGRFAQPKLP